MSGHLVPATKHFETILRNRYIKTGTNLQFCEKGKPKQIIFYDFVRTVHQKINGFE